MERGQSGNRAETRSEMKTRGFAVVLAILLAAVATGAVYLYV